MLAVEIYGVTRAFPKEEQFGLASELSAGEYVFTFSLQYTAFRPGWSKATIGK
jgi:hypothetical protein